MKILIVNAASFIGGAEVWILRLVERLAPRGHAITLAHHRDSPLGTRALAAGARRIWSPPTGVVRPALVLARSIRRERPDVVVSTTRSDLKPAGLAARMAGLPGVVARLNSGWPATAPPRVAGWRWRRHRWYHRRLVQLAATNSAAGKADLVAQDFLPPDRVVVIPNGVDFTRFDPDRVPRGRFRAALGIPADALLIVSIARYAPARGQEAQLEGTARALASRPGAHLALIGTFDPRHAAFRERLAEIAGASPAADRIHLLGPRDDVPEVLADADLLVRVMATEGLANVALEAMAMRVPVVAAAISGMPEAVDDGRTGRLVPPADAEALSRAVGELLDAPEERRRAMGAAGRARVVEGFSLERMAAAYEALFVRSLAERSGGNRAA